MGLGHFCGNYFPTCPNRPSEALHDGQLPKFLLLSVWSSGLPHGVAGGLEVGRFRFTVQWMELDVSYPLGWSEAFVAGPEAVG